LKQRKEKLTSKSKEIKASRDNFKIMTRLSETKTVRKVV